MIRGPLRSTVATQSWTLVAMSILLVILTDPTNGRQERASKRLDFREHLPYSSSSPESPSFFCLKEGYFRHPDDCHSYIRCVDDFGSGRTLKAIEGKCKPGLVFDEITSTCNWPELSQPCISEFNNRRPFLPKTQVTQKPISTLSPIQQDQTIGNKQRQKQPQHEQQIKEQHHWQEEQPKWQQEKEKQQWQQEKEQQQWQQENGQWQSEKEKREKERQQQQAQQREKQREQQREKQREQQRQKQHEQQREEQREQQRQKHEQQREEQREQQRQKQHEQQREQQRDQQRQQQEEQQQKQHEQQRQKQHELQREQQQQKQHKQQQEQQKQQQEMFPEQEKVFNEQTIKNPLNTRISQRPSKPGSIKQATVNKQGQQHSTPEVFDEQERIPVVCNGEGFFRSPSNCSQFYRCVTRGDNGFSVHPFTCPKDLVFDPVESACSQRYNLQSNDQCRRNMNRRGKRSTGGGGKLCKSEGFFRHPKDCRAFYRCVEVPDKPGVYQAHFFSCPATLVFDEEASTCNWPHQAAPCNNKLREPQKTTLAPRKPVSKPTPQRPVSSAKKPSLDRTKQDNPPRPRKPGSTTAPKRAVASKAPSSAKRKSSTSRVTNKPPSGSTKKQPPAPQKPPSTLVRTTRKPNLQAQRKTQSEQRKKTQIKQPQNDESPSTSREQNQSEGNKPQCKAEGYYRHPENCNKFYRCVDFEGDGKKFVRYDFDCPEGLVFDEKNSVCNWPKQTEPCDGGTEGGDSTSEPENGSSSTTDGAEGTGDETDNNPEDGGPGDNVDGEEPSDEQQPDSGTSTQGNGEVTSESSDSSSQSPEGTDGSKPDNGGAGNDGNCVKEGYFRDPENCSKFYRCVDFEGEGKSFIRYDFNCPEGLVFDEVNSVCNWPEQSAPCDGSESQTEGGESKPDKDTETTSSSGTTSNERDSSSTTKESSSKESEATTEGSISTTTDAPATSSNVLSTTSSTSSSKGGSGSKSGECTEEGYFRNSEDCNKFYRCVDFKGDGEFFVRYDFECPEGLIFDEVNSVCNWPEQSPPCDSKDSSKTSTTKEDSDKGTTDALSTADESQSSTEASQTKEPTSSITPTPEPEGEESSATSTESGSTTESEEIKTTEESSSSTESESETSTSSNASTTRSESSEQESTTAGQSSTSSGDSKGECTEAGYFRNPEDCNKFYRCVDFQGDGSSFTRYDFECPEGLVFDEVNSVCNWPQQTPPCESSGGKDKTTSDSKSEGTTIQGSETTASSSSTTSKVSTTTETGSTSQPTEIGSTSQSTESESTSQPTESESTSQQTETGSTSGSDGSTTSTSNQCEKEGFFREPNDCRRFYRCVESNGQLTRYDFECPQGLVFQENSEKCEYPTDEDNPCAENVGSSTTVTDDGSITTGTSSTPVSEVSTSSPTTSSSDDKECKKEGFFRDPDDCRRYYRCLDENDDGTLVKTEYSCEEGEFFDEDMRFCNRADPDNPCQPFQPETSTTASSTASSTLSPTESSTSEATSETTSIEASSTTESSSTSTETDSSGTTSSSTTTSSPTTTSKKSETGASEIECTEAGFFRNPEDCGKFYRCVDFRGDGQSYVRYDFDCPEGLVFDEVNSVCNWPQQSPPCESSSSSSSSGESTTSASGQSTTSASGQSTTSASDQSTTSASDQSTTTKGSTETTSALSTTPSQSSTPRDKDESTSVLTTNEGETTKATSSTTPTTEEGTSTSSSTDDMQSSPSSVTESTKSTTKSGESTTSKGGTSGKIECTEEGFFRNPDDCNKFYRCVDFRGDGPSYVRYDFDCPEGLVFDEVNSVCNWPQQTPPCETKSGAEAENGDENKDTSETTDSTTNTERESSEGANTATTARLTSTTARLTSTTARLTSTTARLTSTTSGDSESSSKPEPSDTQCEEEGFFKDPNDCTRYMRCEKNEETDELTKTEHQCPDDHVFDEEGRYCNSADLSPPCEGGSSNNETSGTTESSQATRPGEFQCQEEGFFRDPEDCGAYYQCKAQEEGGFEKRHVQCPEDHIFDEEGRYCNAEELLPDEESCRKNQPTKSNTKQTTRNEGTTTPSSGTSTGANDSPCNEEGFFRNPDDCTRYYRCSKSESGTDYEKKDYECPDGRIFDEEGRYCNEEELIEGEESCKTTSTSKNEDTSTNTREGNDSSPTESSESTSATSEPGNSRGRGECTEAGFFRNPEDCNKFYRCVDFRGDGQSYVRYDFDCPEGLVFDEVNSVCNWPTITPACDSVDDGVPAE